MDYNAIAHQLTTSLTDVGLKLLAALAFWIVGRWLIHFVISLISRSLSRQQVDPTVMGYVGSTVAVLLNITLVVAILGYFGIQTTTFAALLAAAGLAIGTAWGGLLANFAAGAFIVVLRPFKKGDFISAGGITGTVEEIGLFVTTVNTPDNIRTFVGNNKIFSDNIQNFTTNPYRRVDLVAQLAHSVDPGQAMQLLKARIKQIPNVVTNPEPDVVILTFTLNGPVLAVRPYTHNDHYWQVYFDTNKAIQEVGGSAGFAVPEQHFVIRNA